MSGYPKNFKSSEFECTCGQCGAPPYPDRIRHLAWVLQKVRREVGCPLKITSGYRCEEHNIAVGGSTRSKHLECWAADLKPVGKSVDVLLEAISKLRRSGEIPAGGLGRYSSWVHYDIRPGGPADWDKT